jgi:hypothetical protein
VIVSERGPNYGGQDARGCGRRRLCSEAWFCYGSLAVLHPSLAAEPMYAQPPRCRRTELNPNGDAMKSPGFSAGASLRADRVVPAQRDLGSGGSYGGRYVVSDCPPGQRLTYVEGGTRTKYCDVPAPTLDPVTGGIVWSVQHIPCGTEYVAPHWECQWAFRVFGG